MSVEPSEKERRFLAWLAEHGAVLDKLNWPAVDPATGSRGAMAVVDINVSSLMIWMHFHNNFISCIGSNYCILLR
jgi:hypothetical protein